MIRPLVKGLGSSKRRAGGVAAAVLLLGGAVASWQGFIQRERSSGAKSSDAPRASVAKTLGQLSVVAVGDVAPRATLMWQDVQALSSLTKNVDALVGRDFVFPVGPSGAIRPGSGFGAAPEPRGVDRLKPTALSVLQQARPRVDMDVPLVTTKGGIRFAMLAFADGVNPDFSRRAHRAWARRLDLGPAESSIREASKVADVVIVSIQWGVERHTAPTPRQKRIASRLVAAGADLIVGNQPGELQPIEILRTAGRKAVVAYSLGSPEATGGPRYAAELHAVAQGDSRDAAALRVNFAKVKLRGREATTVIDDVAYEPLWSPVPGTKEPTPRRFEPMTDVASRALEQLDSLVERGARLRDVLVAQEQYRALMIRRERIEGVLGRVQELNQKLRGKKQPR